MTSSKPALAKQLEELTITHSSNILFYSRNKFSGKLAKSIRPEVARIFLTSEAKDCIEIIRKQNKNANSEGINLVILDSDQSSVKVLEYIYKRSKSAKFASYPMISTLVLYTHHDDFDFKKNASLLGGYNIKYVDMPATPQDIFKVITAILFKHQMIDASYREIKETQHSSAYPYLPIYDNAKDNGDDDEDEGEDGADSLIDELAIIGGTTHQNATGISGYELDDWSDGMSMLPNMIVEARAKQLLPDDTEELTDHHLSSSNISKDNKLLAKEMMIRSSKDHMLLEQLYDIHQYDTLVHLSKPTHVNNLITSYDAFKNTTASIPANPSVQVSTRHPGRPLVKHLSNGQTRSNKINLLDIRRRPKWEAKRSTRSKKSSSSTTVAGGENDAEITLYFDRQPPDLTIQRTVGGLNKKLADYCWSVFASYGDLERLKSFTSKASTDHNDDHISHSLQELSIPTISSNSMASTPLGAMAVASPKRHIRLHTPDVHRPNVTRTGSYHPESLPSIWNPPVSTTSASSTAFGHSNFTSNSNSNNNSPRLILSNILSSRSQSVGVQNNTNIIPTPKTGISNILPPWKSYNDDNKVVDDVLNDKTALLDTRQATALDRQFDVYRQALQKAERTLRKLVKDTPPDVQIHRVLEIELLNRNVNIWEKGLFDEGRQAEVEGYLDHAVSSLTRAGINSKEPHLSKLFLGSLYFRSGKYLSSIDNYSEALRMIANIKSSSMYNKEDEFVGRFNRSIAYFRTGNDMEGVKDLEEALKLDPKHIKALEVYAIVLRRLGRYDEAMKANLSIPKDKTSLSSSLLSHHRPSSSARPSIHSINDNNDKNNNSSLGFNKLLHISLHGINNINDNHDVRSTRSRSSRRSSRDGDDTDRSTQPDNKTIVIDISEPKGVNLSLKQRKMVSSIQGKLNYENEEYIESLTAFKLVNGFKTSLFETLFVKPDVLQESLLITPSRRSLHDIEIIGTNLKLVHLFRELSSSIISDVASKIEYRTILPKVEIYSQNQPCDSVCIILKGSIQMKMDGEVKAGRSMKNIMIGPDLGPGDVIGHIDLLFQDKTDSMFMNELRRKIKENELELNHKKINHDDHGDGIVIKGHPDHQQHNNISNNNKTPSHDDPHHQQHKKLNKDNILSKSFAATMIHDAHPSKYMLSRRQSRLSIIREPVALQGIGTMKRHNSSDTLPSRSNSITNHSSPTKPFPLLKSSLSKLGLNINEKSVTTTTSSNAGQSESTGPVSNKHHRTLSSGMLATYSTSTYCEVLLIKESEYLKLLTSICISDFRKRYDVLKASGIYHGWSDYDLIRLARMGYNKSYKQGDILLQQKEKPMYLYFILSGLCKVYKQPNRLEVVERKLFEAKAKAERYDLKYSYHHKLRNVVDHVDVIDVISSSATTINRPHTTAGRINISSSSSSGRIIDSTPTTDIQSSSSDQHDNSPSRVITADITSRITQPESERYKLQVEIQQLETLYQKLLHAATNNSNANINSNYNRPSTSSKLHHIDVTSSTNDDDHNACELATLKWPMMFGEECVLEPDIGASRGSIIATTLCDVFVIHKTQLQTFHIHDHFLAKLKEHAIVYPSDDVLVEMMSKNKAWKAYRHNIVKNLSKTRWPKQVNIFDPFI